MEKVPSRRAIAFMQWMEANNLKTKRVAITAEVPPSTLASFVQGQSQSLKGDTEEKIARAYDTTVDAIFSGAQNQQSQRRQPMVRIIGRVGADASGVVFLSHADVTYDLAPLPPGGTSKTVALEVNGSSMPMLAEDGSLIYFEDQKPEPTPDLIGEVCAVETEDGRILVKRLKRGSEPGLYDLESVIGAPIKDVRLRWAAEITAYVPPRQARRVIVRGSETPS